MSRALYPGSFDPVTFGHIDVMKRACKIFDKVIVAVLVNSSKNPVFSAEERVELIRESVSDIQNVEVDYFSGLLVDYMKKKKAHAIVKGLRAISDFEYEFQMALLNRQLNREVDTVFLTTNVKYMYLSSSMVREIARHGGDVSQFVPKFVEERLAQKYKG